MELEFGPDLVKIPQIKIHENLSSGNQLFIVDKQTSRRADVTKLIVTLCSVALMRLLNGYLC